MDITALSIDNPRSLSDMELAYLCNQIEARSELYRRLGACGWIQEEYSRFLKKIRTATSMGKFDDEAEAQRHVTTALYVLGLLFDNQHPLNCCKFRDGHACSCSLEHGWDRTF